MRLALALSLLATSITLGGCQKRSDTVAASQSTNADEEMRTMGAHDPQGCPDLQGIYVPTGGKGAFFLFEKVEGNLVMKTRTPQGSEFQGAVPMNGRTSYSGAESASARCSGGKILVELTHPSKPKKLVLLKGDQQSMTRLIFEEGQPAKTTEYARMIQ